ncbi:MAG: DUF3299 domain-containing protein [Ekhidna sp.]|nr:DUF3299 domain-containing protein [Ekhidna sp.]MBC6424915.1 DUF3299 domain-containing protein [Ekhidna sp.]
MYLIISILLVVAYPPSGWEIFEDTRFKWQYNEDLGMEIEIPVFNKKIKALDGQEITLTGHYLPLDLEGNSIIISKLPYASCFFCGGGVGQESVVEVEFSSVQRPFRMDELVTVQGKLKLNVDDYEHLVFMITNAKVI